MNNPSDMLAKMNHFKKEFQQNNPDVSPQEYIQKMMNQGKISQQKFEQARSFVAAMGFKV